MRNSFITGEIHTNSTNVPVVTSALKITDILGAMMVRWGINRSNYRVEPGLYAIGNPGADSDVFVTANYKLSFDQLRKNLSSVSGWIMVLDTKGVNVWCAAGKGTFSGREIIKKIKSVSLENIVTHKKIIVPQLGATGVAAHKVKEETGFNVHYGPVRASDIKKFIASGYRADKDMRRVRFDFTDRIKLIPNDLIFGKYYLLVAIAVMYLLSGISSSGISFRDFSGTGFPAIFKVFLGYFAGVVITPALLPYIPGRHFSLKGLIAGALIYLTYLLIQPYGNIPEIISWLFFTSAISSFMAMNFTGSSTYTSLSGVKKEMKLFVPVQIVLASLGIILFITGKLI
jgi:hypothetical protein